MSKITNLKYDQYNNEITFNINNIDLSYVNALRRTILSSFNVWGIRGYPHEDRTIRFINNTTKVDNEQLSKVISLIPINLTPTQLEQWNPEDYEFHLDEQNKFIHQKLITSQHIKIYNKKTKTYLDNKTRDQIFPPSPISKQYIAILNLNPNYELPEHGEKLHIVAQPVISNATENVSFQYQRAYYSNSLDNKKIQEQQDILNKEFKGDEKKDNIFNTLQKYRLFIKNQYDEPTHFDFTVESQSQQIKPQYIVQKSLEFMINMVNDSTIKYSIENNSTKIKLLYDIETKFTFTTIVQKHFIIKYIRPNKKLQSSSKKQYQLSFVGQHQIHPLENYIVQDFQFEDSITIEEFKDIINVEFSEIIKQLTDLLQQFKSLYK